MTKSLHPPKQYTEDWFSGNVKMWKKLFDFYGHRIKNVLEIGAYEGRATVWLCQNIPSIKTYTVIDTFKGSSNESGMTSASKHLNKDINFIENTFKQNIKEFTSKINFTIHKGESQKVMPTIKHSFDFIYIDGSHRSDDVFIDGYWAHKLLNTGGIIIFDDVRWKDPKRLQAVENPLLGIRFWYTSYGEHYYTRILDGYQMGFGKKHN